MPKAVSKASSKASPVRKQRRSGSRSRTDNSSVKDESSRVGSPSRRGRPPGRSRSRSPARGAKATTKNEVFETTSAKRTYPEPSGTETGARSRKKTEPSAGNQNYQKGVPNGTHELSVMVGDPYIKKLRSSDRPHTPKINTSIFDNIQLTPSQTPRPAVGKALSPTGSKKGVRKQWYGKEAVDRSLIWLRKSYKKVRAHAPSWKVLVAVILIALAIFASVYVYLYHREAVIDYYKIVQAAARRKLTWSRAPPQPKKPPKEL